MTFQNRLRTISRVAYVALEDGNFTCEEEILRYNVRIDENYFIPVCNAKCAILSLRVFNSLWQIEQVLDDRKELLLIKFS